MDPWYDNDAAATNASRPREPFGDLQKRNERRARIARVLATQRERRRQAIERVVQAPREHRLRSR